MVFHPSVCAAAGVEVDQDRGDSNCRQSIETHDSLCECW